MSNANLYKVLRKNISVDILARVLPALKRDALIWSALENPEVLGNALKFATSDAMYWKPSNIALLSVIDLVSR